jgi:hypothetical protein
VKSIAAATAGLVLRGAKESADAFPPLKSALGALCFIMDNCEVPANPYTTGSGTLIFSLQKTMACRKKVESLIPRVEGLGQSLNGPVPDGEVKEEERREVLKR